MRYISSYSNMCFIDYMAISLIITHFSQNLDITCIIIQKQIKRKILVQSLIKLLKKRKNEVNKRYF